MSDSPPKNLVTQIKLSIKNDVHLALAKGEATAVVLLDQTAAFDPIDHV